MRQKRNRKPALGLEVGCGFGRSSFMKKTVNLRDSSKLDPLRFSVFFVCFANPDGAAVRTAARLCGARGARCGAGRRAITDRPACCTVANAGITAIMCNVTSHVSQRTFPLPRRRFPAAGRLRSNRIREADRKRAGNLRGKFTCTFRFSDSFSYRLRQAFTPTNAGFRVGLREELLTQKLPP